MRVASMSPDPEFTNKLAVVELPAAKPAPTETDSANPLLYRPRFLGHRIEAYAA